MQIVYRAREKLNADDQNKLKGFECVLMAVNPSQSNVEFGEKDWFPKGQATLTKDNLDVVIDAVRALKGTAPRTPNWYSPMVALRVEIPATGASQPAEQYVILLKFDTKSMELYSNRKRIGTSTIADTRPWRDILTNAGISLTSQPVAAN